VHLEVIEVIIELKPALQGAIGDPAWRWRRVMVCARISSNSICDPPLVFGVSAASGGYGAWCIIWGDGSMTQDARKGYSA
jgi:hypothetical protein